MTLTVTNNSGQTDQIEHDVKVDSAPTAAFSVPAGAQAPSTSLGFDASASVAAPPDGSITSYSWDFGDGATGTGASPHHSYNNPGQYTVSLTVTDELGLSNTTTHQVTVDAAPAASFSASPSPATVGPSVAFDGCGSSDTLGSITSYSWEFRRRRHRLWFDRVASVRCSRAIHGQAKGDQRRRPDRNRQVIRSPLTPRPRRCSRSRRPPSPPARPSRSTRAARAMTSARSPTTAGASGMGPEPAGPRRATRMPVPARTRSG